MNKKPVIAINLDLEESGDYSDYPYYVLRKNYFDAIEKAGGIALGIPYEKDNLNFYLENCDGLLIPGGHFDIPTEFYTKSETHSTVKLKPGRSEFEFAMIHKFLEANKPVLGICGGEQVIAVALGCTLIQDITSEVAHCLEHEVKNREADAHKITIKKNSLLHKITNKDELGVNSSHHQAVKDLGKNIIACAHSSDGVIEAIESTEYKFCLGVQWHPEYLFNHEELNIFKSFVDSCK